jgi:hypothetical protein
MKTINIELLKEMPMLQLSTLHLGLQTESRGYKLTRKVRGQSSCNAVVKKLFGFKGNKQKVLQQFEDALILSELAYEKHGKLEFNY